MLDRLARWGLAVGQRLPGKAQCPRVVFPAEALERQGDAKRMPHATGIDRVRHGRGKVRDVLFDVLDDGLQPVGERLCTRGTHAGRIGHGPHRVKPTRGRRQCLDSPDSGG